MITFVFRRLLMLPLVVFFSTMFVFLLMQALPAGVRVAAYTNQSPSAYRDIAELIQLYGLDQPVWVQYGNWISNIFQGNLGWSTSANMTVVDAFKSYLPATAELALFSIVPLFIAGIWLGTKSAVHHNSLPDHASRVVSIAGWSLPTFVAGLFLLMIFYGVLGWFPPGRIDDTLTIAIKTGDFVRYTGMYTIDAIMNGHWELFWNAVRHLVLPSVTLAYVSWAWIVRIMRSSMLNVLREDYTRTARAKGLREKVVVNKHARRNALIPVITVSAVIVALLLNGVVVTETIFNFFGIGWWFVRAAQSMDISAVLGFTIFNSLLWGVANLSVDVIYSMVDPRIRLN
jgi:peptide/nickel transport system permease protein